MKKLLGAFWRICVLTIVYFIVNSILGILLPLSNDMMANMTSNDQALFFPLFLLNAFINMLVLYLLLKNMRFRGWKLFLSVWLTMAGLMSIMNCIELYWFNDAFPLFTYLDVTRMILTAIGAYGAAALAGTGLVKGFKREEQPRLTRFDTGKWGWKLLTFCVAYAFFYFACGFIPWLLFPEVSEFYASWALAPNNAVLILFNVFRGALWLLFSTPILIGVQPRKKVFWLLPLALNTGTAIATIIPSAVMPGIIRLAHFIELGFSMTIVGLFAAWFFVKSNTPTE